MRLINVKAFLKREQVMSNGGGKDWETEVLAFTYDESTPYAILSHRWTDQEVNYEEMVDLAKMEKKDQIRHRLGYQKILASCKQAEGKFKWLWVDTCCIDKRSSAELSEAINSMYRWYENAGVCYAYLHDVPDPLFPTAGNLMRYFGFNAWPEWFSRGWTLQELIAPSNVQFFNKNWKSIGDKRTLAPTLASITRIPEDILTHGFCGNRPCVAQIMSWAANRRTTRVEDRAYSLMGLLEVNMPMLYGEGKKAFHRLQLEIIRTSNDQSIFAWDCINHKTGNILADDPGSFWLCGEMELMDHNEYIEFLKEDGVPEEELDSIEDRLGTFPITNRGIHIWLPLCPYRDFRTLFKARLPCRIRPSWPPQIIYLVLSESNYYRDPGPDLSILRSTDTTSAGPSLRWRLCQVYLRYQDPPRRTTIFKVDDTALIENGFTYCGTYPKEFAGDTLTLTSINCLGIKVYSDNPTNTFHVVGLGQYLGNDWIHVVSDESNTIPRTSESWEFYVYQKYWEMRDAMRAHARHVNKARSRVEQVCIMQTRLLQSDDILQISSVMWKSSRICGVKLGVFHDPGSSDVSGEWTAFDVDGTSVLGCDWRGLMMLLDRPKKYINFEIDGGSCHFLDASDSIELGDYGHFTDSKEFCSEGNLFADLKSLSMADIRKHKPSSYDWMGWHAAHIHNLHLHNSLILSLPSDDNFKSLLTSLSTQLANKYLVTRIVQHLPDPGQPSSNITGFLYSIAKPFVWHRNESAGSGLDKWSGEAKGDQVGVNDNEMML